MVPGSLLRSGNLTQIYQISDVHNFWQNCNIRDSRDVTWVPRSMPRRYIANKREAHRWRSFSAGMEIKTPVFAKFKPVLNLFQGYSKTTHRVEAFSKNHSKSGKWIYCDRGNEIWFVEFVVPPDFRSKEGGAGISLWNYYIGFSLWTVPTGTYRYIRNYYIGFSLWTVPTVPVPETSNLTAHIKLCYIRTLLVCGRTF